MVSSEVLHFRIEERLATKIALVLGDFNVSDFIHKVQPVLTKYVLVGSSSLPYQGLTGTHKV